MWAVPPDCRRKQRSMADEASKAGEGGSHERKQPAWFTPERLLAVLCVINLLNYVDRGAIASNGVNGSLGNVTCSETESCYEGRGIQGDFALSYFEDGLLSSSFMVGLLIASPIFAELSKTFDPMKLIGVGLSVWTVATAGCGVSFNFWSIACFRMLVGVAEASFISLAAPFIDDYAPPEKRTVWLSLFYSCIPVGVALGYVYGGVMGGMWSWRAAFWIESLFMLPFAVFGFVSNPIHLKAQQLHLSPSVDHCTALLHDGGEDHYTPAREVGVASRGHWLYLVRIPEFFKKQAVGIGEDLKKLLSRKVYVIDVLGYIFYNFVLGAYAYWGPKAGEVLFQIDNADMVFGALTIFAGVFGTLFGGFALDYIGATIPKAFKFLSIVTFAGGVMCFIAFSAKSLKWFIPLFALGEFCIFATQGPVNYVTLHSVPSALRPIAIAMSTLAIHIFGDVPSSPIVGAVQDIVQDWRVTALLLTGFLFVGSAVWGCGALLQPPNEAEGEADSSPPDVSPRPRIESEHLGCGPER